MQTAVRIMKGDQNNMKRVLIILAVAAAIVLALSFAGCAAPEEAPAQETPVEESAPQAGSEAAEEASDEEVWNLVAPLKLEYYEEGTGPVFEFTTANLEGEEVDQSVIQGKKVTMVNVWATFCYPCLSEMPDLGKLAADYADKGFGLVGVVTDVNPGDEEMIAEAADIVADTGAAYPHLILSESLINAMLRDVQYVPTTYFVDENGACIAKAVVGSNSYDRWAATVEELLAR